MEKKAIKNKAIKNKIIKLKLNADLNDYNYIKDIIEAALIKELNKLLNYYGDEELNFPEYYAIMDALKQL